MLHILELRLFLASLFFVLGFIVEAIVSAEESHASLRFNLVYAVLIEAFNVSAGVLLLSGLNSVISKVSTKPLLAGGFSDKGNVGLAILIAMSVLFVKDFFTYWCHRLQHTKWLWPEHLLHHSDEHVNVTTALRHHWMEGAVQTVFVVFPMALLMKPTVITVTGILVAVRAFDYFIHLNARISLGSFLVSPQSHRIHHSRLPQHSDKNFAAVFPIIDILFGTWFPPEKEPPPTGVSEPVNPVYAATLLPFSSWWRMTKVARSR
jgi:sterol desaturase/sphingolipid hydroxylase (fatty acid hydroxylase superfamily)